jgi:hypothetical protein
VGKKEERREHAPGTLAGQYPDSAGIESTVASRERRENVREAGPGFASKDWKEVVLSKE